MFKDSIEEIQLRRSEKCGCENFRKRTVSDQPQISRTAQVKQSDAEYTGILKKTNEESLMPANIKDQLNDLQLKIDTITKKLEEISNQLIVRNKTDLTYQ